MVDCITVLSKPHPKCLDSWWEVIQRLTSEQTHQWLVVRVHLKGSAKDEAAESFTCPRCSQSFLLSTSKVGDVDLDACATGDHTVSLFCSKTAPWPSVEDLNWSNASCCFILQYQWFFLEEVKPDVTEAPLGNLTFHLMSFLNSHFVTYEVGISCECQQCASIEEKSRPSYAPHVAVLSIRQSHVLCGCMQSWDADPTKIN